MFLEKTGRFLLRDLRLPIFFSILAALPLCTGVFLYIQKQSVVLFQEQYFIANGKAKSAIEKKERKERFLQRHAQSNPLFLEKNLIAFSFLQREKEKLKIWIAHPALTNKHDASNRLHFLGENRLLFQEEEVQISNLCRETLEKQKRPVEMDSEDLSNVLALIEEPIVTVDHRPQLLITEFSLHKKPTSLQNEVLEIKFDLLKREFK